MDNFDVVVVGGGAVGLFAALALKKAGVNFALVAPLAGNDYKTTALMQPSIQALENLGVLEALPKYPLKSMRLIDVTDSIIKAPQVTFECSELQLEQFGFNIENKEILTVFEEALKGVKRFFSPLKNLSKNTLILEDGTELSAKLIIGADGRNSKVRETSGLSLNESLYDQVALVSIISHSKVHNDCSTEFHTNQGPITFVPLGEKRSSLVWVMKKSEGERRKNLALSDLTQELERLTQLTYGRLVFSETKAFIPLSLARPSKLIAENIALVGEAAHVLPPIGAQGMNLGFRDVAWLLETFEHHDIGSSAQLEAYAKARNADILLKSTAVDGLNRSLLTSFTPFHSLRALSFWALEKINPLRERVMKQGIAFDNLPKLMNKPYS